MCDGVGVMAVMAELARRDPFRSLIPVAMKLANSFGAQTFSRMFHLRSNDELAVRRLFTPAILPPCEKHPGLRFSGSGASLSFFRRHHRAKPDQLAAFVAESRELAALFVPSQDPADVGRRTA